MTDTESKLKMKDRMLETLQAELTHWQGIAGLAAADIVALRARVAELGRLVPVAYAEGWGDGRRENDPLASLTKGWNCSFVRAALEQPKS